jgi:hypothetical protein
VVEVAESRESERDMATEAGAKVEGRMLEVGEEKKCILVVRVVCWMGLGGLELFAGLCWACPVVVCWCVRTRCCLDRIVGW